MIASNRNQRKTHVAPYKRRDRSHVSGHVRRHPSVKHDNYRHQIERVATFFKECNTTLLLQAKCSICHEEVLFYQDKTLGCTAYDSLESPWIVHQCWAQYSHSMIKGLAQVLIDVGHDGLRYQQQLKRIERTQNRTEETIMGYVLSRGRSMEFPSYRNSSSAGFMELAFVPADRPDSVMRVAVPKVLQPLFDEHPAHRLQVRHVRFKRQWQCFAEATTPLVPGLTEPSQACSIVNFTDRCVWCGKIGVLGGRWGFDTEHRVECSDCGSRRRELSSDAFEKSIQDWSRHLRRR